MKEILEKISSYNLFNYLLPGALFAAFAEWTTDYKIIQDDIVIGLFLYYFIGLVISRIGSLLIEPLMRFVKFVKFSEYADFVIVSKDDTKLDTLSEVNNTYRTLCSLFICLLLTKLVAFMAAKFSISTTVTGYSVFGLLLLLFAFAYRKQTDYITKRIDAKKDKCCINRHA